MFLQRNVASQTFVIPGSLRAVADGSAVTSSASMTVVKDGTSAAAAGTLTHISGGAYKYTPTQAETDCKIFGYVLEAAGAVTVCGSTRTTNADPNDAAALGLTRIDAAVTSRSSHTAADVWTSTTRILSAGTNIVLAKGTGITGFNDIAAASVWGVARSGNQTSGTFGEYVDAAIGSRSTYAGADTPGTTTLLSRLTVARAVNLDNLDAAVSTRLATSGYTVPPSAATVATTVWQDLTTGSDFTATDSVGKLIKDNVDAAISSRSTYAGADTGGTTTLLGRLTSTRAGNLDNLDAAVSSRSSHTAADVWNDGVVAVRVLTGFSFNVTIGGYAAGQDPATLALDASAASHNTANTIGAKINASASAGDPWGTAIPGTYSDGTAGAILGSFSDPMPLTTVADAILDRADAVETGETPRNLFRRLRSFLASPFNKTDTPGTFVFKRKDGTTEAFRTVNDSQGNRISSTDGTL